MLSTNEKIVALRHRHSLTQEAVAEKIGMSAPTFIDREKGRSFWRLDELNRLAAVLDVPLKDLIGDCDNETTMQ